mmetsp:Transcript_19076/g.64428  ORF Transcript_19076/g.64428 Transcript_19076/m.64428 type:complete len:255 (-) Transcript_19076:150-914(-)
MARGPGQGGGGGSGPDSLEPPGCRRQGSNGRNYSHGAARVRAAVHLAQRPLPGDGGRPLRRVRRDRHRGGAAAPRRRVHPLLPASYSSTNGFGQRPNLHRADPHGRAEDGVHRRRDVLSRRAWAAAHAALERGRHGRCSLRHRLLLQRRGPVGRGRQHVGIHDVLLSRHRPSLLAFGSRSLPFAHPSKGHGPSDGGEPRDVDDHRLDVPLLGRRIWLPGLLLLLRRAGRRRVGRPLPLPAGDERQVAGGDGRVF